MSRSQHGQMLFTQMQSIHLNSFRLLHPPTHTHLFRHMDAGTHLHTDTAIYKMTFSLVSWLVPTISALLEVETAGSGIHRSLLGIILWRLP